METIDWSKVTQIYYGKDAWCRCGCGGSYAEPNTPIFTRYKNAIEKLDSHSVVDTDKDDNYINFSLPNGKAYTVYF